MRLVFHGGKCCGIKTIYGLGTDPDEILESEPKAPYPRNHDSAGEHVNSNLDFFTDEAPEESAKDRLDRLIAFCEKRRPCGIIEIVLADSQYPMFDQLPPWEKLLRRRKFKRVTPKGGIFNSNSGNNVHVYHRYTVK
jgi:hypothetical protein